MRRLKKAQIKFISLVPAGANLLKPVYKAEDNTVSFGTLIKASTDFDDKGELTAVVYAPNLRDSQGDIADAECVKQMAHDFIANGGSIDIMHDGKTVGRDKAQVAETFLVQKSDDRFHGWKDRDGNQVDLTGAWASIIKIHDADLRKKYRSGEWAGVSMGGTAVVEQEKAAVDQLVELLRGAINPPPNQPSQENSDMTPAELAEITKTMKDGFTTMTAELTKALKPEPVAPVQKQDGPPVFKGDWGNERLVKKHLRDIQIYQLKEATVGTDASLAKEFVEGLRELRKEWAEEDKVDGVPAGGSPFLPRGPGDGGTPAVVRKQHYGGQQVTALESDLLLAGEAVAKSLQPAAK